MEQTEFIGLAPIKSAVGQTKHFPPTEKICYYGIKNYFQALKIYNQALKIYNQALKIYFQALKIIILGVLGCFSAGSGCFIPWNFVFLYLHTECFTSRNKLFYGTVH